MSNIGLISPKPLFKIAVNVFVDSFHAYSEYENGRQILRQDILLPPGVADDILKRLLKLNKISPDNCLNIFPAERASLTRLSLSDVRVSPESLRRLRNHELFKVEARRLHGVNLSTLSLTFGERTMTSLTSLDISGTSILSHNCPIIIALARLKNLVSLNVSNTEFDTRCLESAARDLPNLVELDISSTRVESLDYLARYCLQLRALRLYHSRIRYPEYILVPLTRMKQLVSIDISEDGDSDVHCQRTEEVDLMCKTQLWPNLRSINVSGNRFRLSVSDVASFLRLNPRLDFIGLACWSPDEGRYVDELKLVVEEAITVNSQLNPDSPCLKVALEKGTDNIKEILRRYPDRQSYIERALYKIYECTDTLDTVDAELTNLILVVSKRYIRQYSIALTACACLYNLTRYELGAKMPVALLNKAMMFVLRIMALFPTNTRLQKNCFLFLCSDYILHHAKFDNLECCKLTLNALDAASDESVRRMGMAVVSILAAKISISDLAVLADEPRYMRRCLLCVAEKCLLRDDLVKLGVDAEIPQNRQREVGGAIVDTTLRFTLSALWNLTDECPESCDTFIKQNGLDIYVRLLERFENATEFTQVHIFTKCLGLLNNLAEVEKLRYFLLRSDLMRHLKKLMLFRITQVGYFAAGIVAHLGLLDASMWNRLQDLEMDKNEDRCLRSAFLHRLRKAVTSWKPPESDMVAYRSFRPFVAILKPGLRPEIYLWALWAMNHVCTRNSKRYMPLLRALPKMQELLVNIAKSSNYDNSEYFSKRCNLKGLASNILSYMGNSSSESGVLCDSKESNGPCENI